MGHKAMVAYEISKNVYNLHFSPWGADDLKLLDHIKFSISDEFVKFSIVYIRH